MSGEVRSLRVADFVQIFQPSVARIVDVLLDEPDTEFTFKELLSRAQVGTATLHRGLGVLAERGVVVNGKPFKTRGPLAQTWKLAPVDLSLMVVYLQEMRKLKGRW